MARSTSDDLGTLNGRPGTGSMCIGRCYTLKPMLECVIRAHRNSCSLRGTERAIEQAGDDRRNSQQTMSTGEGKLPDPGGMVRCLARYRKIWKKKNMVVVIIMSYHSALSFTPALTRQASSHPNPVVPPSPFLVVVICR
ncbi:unnamed protein product [Gongylonema pulchrum]|uniref:Uncharacterized protein n=1 Tax=Gongylonema pulchrum TaxID=637853 RepID=A0A183DUJ1_9BILA|nr:unnamed protein product [Gongylonema pulchrum]